jgi:hypothetical protein
MSTHEFSRTNILRGLSIIFLGVGDFFLLMDRWIYFFLCITMAIFFEFNRHKLYDLLVHHHLVHQERIKQTERERQAEALEELKAKRAT